MVKGLMNMEGLIEESGRVYHKYVMLQVIEPIRFEFHSEPKQTALM